MSGRIETYGSQKEQTSKWSKNESMTVKEAGVDIEKDPEEKRPSSYLDLTDKPSINGVSLAGNKSLDDLDIQKKLTAGTGISISEDEETHDLVISEVESATEEITLNQYPNTGLGWSDVQKVYVKNGLAQVAIRCGTNDFGITEEQTKLYYGFPEPIGDTQLYGLCEGVLYRFSVRVDENTGEIALYSRSKIQVAWKEIVINGSYICK